MKTYNFNEIINRCCTESYKWQRYDKGVLPMWIADMDLPVADEICEALKKRAEHPIFGYATATKEATDCVIASLKKRFNWEVQPDWIVWLPGIVPAINAAARAFAGPGKGIIINPPIYTQIYATANLSHSNAYHAPMKLVVDHWELDKQKMEEVIGSDTTLLILCSPHNPIGHVYSREDLEWIADFAKRHNLVVCSDEIHCDLILDSNKTHIPSATINADMEDRCLTFMAPSKTYNIPGLGCAYAIIKNPTIRAQFAKETEHIIPAPNAFAYTACIAAYTHGETWLNQCLEFLRENAEYCATELAKLPYIKVRKPEATYLIWIDCSQLPVENPFDFFYAHGIALDKGECFGDPQCLRLNFACPRETLEQGISLIKKALASLENTSL